MYDGRLCSFGNGLWVFELVEAALEGLDMLLGAFEFCVCLVLVVECVVAFHSHIFHLFFGVV